MTRRTGFSIGAQLALWIAGSSLAGAVVGMTALFLQGHRTLQPAVGMSVLLANVVGLTVLLCSLAVIPRLRALSPLARGSALGLALLSGSLAGSALVLYWFPLLVLVDPRRTVALVALNGMLALLVGGVVYAYEGLRDRLAESLREVEEVRLVQATLRAEAARAELAALQARINPHFFFNTLNTISSLLEDDPRRAERVVETLAELFRYALRVSDAKLVTLAQELEFVDGYLEIEQARFGERLRVTREVARDTLEVEVPGLLVQPLVENAVLHGIAPIPAGGSIRIGAHLIEDRLVVEVEDDGAGLPRSDAERRADGHGLANVQRRLAALYGGRASLAIAPRASGRGTTVRLHIPR